MNIKKIKNDILELKDIKLKIKVNIGRNKHEYYEGIIEKLYSKNILCLYRTFIKSLFISQMYDVFTYIKIYYSVN